MTWIEKFLWTVLMQPIFLRPFNHSILQTMQKNFRICLTWVIWRLIWMNSTISTTWMTVLLTVKSKGLRIHLLRILRSIEKALKWIERVQCQNWMIQIHGWYHINQTLERENHFLTCAQLNSQLTPVTWCKHKPKAVTYLILASSKRKVVFRLILQKLALTHMKIEIGSHSDLDAEWIQPKST